MTSRSRRALRRVGVAVLAVLLGAAAAFGWYFVSPEPGAAMVKWVFELSPEVTPPSDFDTIEASVTKTRVPLEATDASLDIFTPDAADEPLPIVLWIHGGGFISSSSSTVEDYSVLLANEGYVVASLDYSLAPGSEYPTPVIQGNDALAYLAQHAAEVGGDATKVVIGGDSAGAQIASQLSAVQTNPELASSMGLTSPLEPGAQKGVILFCGLYDMETVGDSGFPAIRTYLWSYTGHRDWLQYPDVDQLSTTQQVTADYPPTFLTVGDADPFASQGAEMVDALEDAGVPVTSLFWTDSGKGLQHEYQFDFSLPEATEAFDQTTDFLHEVTQ